MDDSQSQDPQVTETIKIGEKEYSQADIEKLVGLGEIAREAEEKYNTKIDKVWPEYTKATQRISEYEKAQQEKETRDSQELTKKQSSGAELSQEELKRMAAQQLKDLMKDPEVQAELRQNYLEQRQAEKLIEDSEYVVNQAKQDGKPVTSIDDILKHMAETGIKNPQKAYNDMFEAELDSWKEAQLNKLRKPGLYTEPTSTAGAKQPASVTITRSNLKDLLHEEIMKGVASRGE